MLSVLLLIVGLGIIVVSANGLVEGASALAKRFNISDLVIGLTIVAFGTSAPELSVSIYAAINAQTDIAIGNIVGSNIFNVFFILGVCAMIYPVSVQKSSIWIEIPLTLLAALVLGVCANDRIIDGASTSQLTATDGLIFLGFFAIFMYYTFTVAKASPDETAEEVKTMPLWKSLLFITLGLAGLVFGGQLLVDAAVEIAKFFGMSEAVVGLTIVAAGTSTPELATSAVAAYKKKSDIALGNVVGSNIFNIFFILGITSLVSPLPFREAANVDIMMTIFSSIVLFAFVMIGKGWKISRSEGAIMLMIYIAYVVYLVMQVS